VTAGHTPAVWLLLLLLLPELLLPISPLLKLLLATSASAAGAADVATTSAAGARGTGVSSGGNIQQPLQGDVCVGHHSQPAVCCSADSQSHALQQQ
jgi:hypothetical protein